MDYIIYKFDKQKLKFIAVFAQRYENIIQFKTEILIS